MNTAQKYINGLKQAYYANDAKQQWDHFEKIIHGADQQDLDKLRSIYPNIPNSLIQLLEFADGTYWREYEDMVEMDEKIIDDALQMHWLYFSDCINNGGTSQLFIDFSPSPKGKLGQIARFLHNPDEIEIIADSFDKYLQMLMNGEYNFITEDDMAEDNC